LQSRHVSCELAWRRDPTAAAPRTGEAHAAALRGEQWPRGGGQGAVGSRRQSRGGGPGKAGGLRVKLEHAPTLPLLDHAGTRSFTYGTHCESLPIETCLHAQQANVNLAHPEANATALFYAAKVFPHAAMLTQAPWPAVHLSVDGRKVAA